MTIKLTDEQQVKAIFLYKAFDLAREALLNHLAPIKDEWESEFDDKSDEWKEGDEGLEAKIQIDTLDEVVGMLEEFETPPMFDGQQS